MDDAKSGARNAFSGQPAPPQVLLDIAGGPGTTPINSLAVGYNISEEMRTALRLVGRDFREFGEVLDFGCGCSRVLRWFDDLARNCRFHGTDINADAIEWSRAHIAFAEFSQNEPWPPLRYPSERFDLIYGISVLTHLDETFQLAWLEEIWRIAKPGAIVMLTALGDWQARNDLVGDAAREFAGKGLVYRQIHEATASGLPAFYQLTYHSRQYIERIWSRDFRLLAFIRQGPLYFQDLVVMEKPAQHDGPHERPRPAYLYVDLPRGSVGPPEFGAIVDGSEVAVQGWAFHPDGGTLELDVWLDGDRVASCAPDIPRPDVAALNQGFPNAAVCGFTTTLSTERWAPGRHVLSMSARTNLVPMASTCLFKEE